jgi:hypothetical protein
MRAWISGDARRIAARAAIVVGALLILGGIIEFLS